MVSKAWINLNNDNNIIVHVGSYLVFDQFLIYYTDADASLLLSVTVDDHSKKLEQLEGIVARLEASGM